MLSDLPIFQVYSAMARHAAESQRVSATNISRAGEPGYKAQKVESFEDYMTRSKGVDSTSVQTMPFRTFESSGPQSPNGNSVNIEQEMFSSAQAMGQHNMALTVYTKSLELMRTALGKGR